MGKTRGKKAMCEIRVTANVSGFLIFLMCLSASAQTQASNIEGAVTDTAGAAIAGARILVHWDPSGSAVGLRTNVGIKHDVQIEADKYGKFAVRVPAGFYDIFVSAEAFSPHAEKVRVNPTSKVTIYPKLPPDPLVTKELGDAFFDK